MKTRRFFAFVLTALMVIQCTFSVDVFAADNTEKVVYEQNFDGKKMAELNTNQKGNGKAEIVKDSDYGDSLHFVTTGTSGDAATFAATFPNVSMSGTISFSIKYANSYDWTSLYFGSSINLYLSSGSIGSHLGKTTANHAKISANEWHDVDVNFDVPAAKYDVYVDYEKVASSVNFRNAAAFSAFNVTVDKINNDITIDNIKITSKNTTAGKAVTIDTNKPSKPEEPTVEPEVKEMITAGEGETITEAKADTYIGMTGRSAAYGYASSVVVTRDNASNEKLSFFKFDAPEVPAGKRAYLNLWLSGASCVSDNEVFTVYAADNAWDENITSPEGFVKLIGTAGRGNFGNSDAKSWVKVDITDYVKDNAGKEISLSLRGSSVTASSSAVSTLTFDSRENVCKPNILVCDPIDELEKTPPKDDPMDAPKSCELSLAPLSNVSAALSSGREINMYAVGASKADISMYDDIYGDFAKKISAKSAAQVNYINKGLSSLDLASASSRAAAITEDQTPDLVVVDFDGLGNGDAEQIAKKYRGFNRYCEFIFVTDNTDITVPGSIAVSRASLIGAAVSDIPAGAVKSYTDVPNEKYNLKAKDSKDVVDYLSFDRFNNESVGDGFLFEDQAFYYLTEDDNLIGGKYLRMKKDTARGKIAAKYFATSLGGNLRFDFQLCIFSPDTNFNITMFPTARDSYVMDRLTFNGNVMSAGVNTTKVAELNYNQWYNIAILYDMHTNMYDVVIDGETVKRDVATNLTTGTICSYEFNVSAGQTADFAIDSIRTSYYTDAEKGIEKVEEVVEEDDGPAVIFDNDFEQTAVGTISTGTSGNVAYVRDEGNTFIRATRTTGTGSCTTNFSFGETKGDVSLELDFRLNDLSGATKLLYLNTASGAFTVPIYFSTDKMQLNISGNERPIVKSGLVPGQWYHIQIITDLSNQKYKIFLDGEESGDGEGYALLNTPVSSFSSFRISISAGEHSTYDVDNILVQKLNSIQTTGKNTAAGYDPINSTAPENNAWIEQFRRNPTGEIYEAEDMQLYNYEVYKDLNFHNEMGIRVASTGCGVAEFTYNGETGYKRIDLGYLEENGDHDSYYYVYQNGQLIDWFVCQNDQVGRYNRNAKDYWYVKKGDKFTIRATYGDEEPSELDYVEFSDGAKRDFKSGDLVGEANRAQGYRLSSGWDVDKAGGWASQGVELRDTSTADSVDLYRRLTGFYAPFVVEYAYTPFANSKYDALIGYSDGENCKYPIDIKFDGQSIIVDGNRHDDVLKKGGTTYLRFAVDTYSKTYTVVADSVVIEKDVPFACDIPEFNIFRFLSDKASTSYFRAWPFAIKAGYVINEDFRCESASDVELYNWDVSGSTFVISDNAENCDPFHRGLNENTVITKSIRPQTGVITFETQILFPEKKDGARVAIGNSDGGEIALFTKDGSIYYDAGDGKTGLLWENYKPNVWYEYKLEIDMSGHSCKFYVNSFKSETVDITDKLTSADYVKISSGAAKGSIWVDDIAIFNGTYLDDNEVPEIELPEGYGDYNVVMQTCDMWREGTHFGYDCLAPYASRTPFLGYLEEGNPEVSDWQTKYMAEHGVNVFAPCWYMPNDAKSAPKNPRNGYSLDQGFMNSKYQDKIQFALNLTYAGVNEGEENFLKYYVNYWIEHYFKHPSYFKIDNKPVIFSFNVGEFSNQFGSSTSDILNKVRQMCINEGFDGAIFVGTVGNTDVYAGWDYAYSYSLGSQRDGYTVLSYAKKYAKPGSVPYLASPSQGWGEEAWGRSVRKINMPLKDWEASLEWVRDVYMTANSDDPVLKNTVSLDNWNEYCEGHTLAPSNLAGFGYLDAVRNVFTKADKEHTDIIPEKRFDQMSAILW